MSERNYGLTRKSIQEPKSETDGLRILTVSRKTENDGKTPSTLFTEESYNEWWKELAPTGYLVGAWYRGDVTRREFEKYYRLTLKLPRQAEAIQKLIELSKVQRVTVLCVCKIQDSNDYCHTLTLLEVCNASNT